MQDTTNANWYDQYIPSGKTVNNVIGQAMRNFTEIEKSKVGARLNATRPLQAASMNTVPIDDQSTRKTGALSNPKMIWIAGGIAAVVVLGLVYVAMKK